MKAKLLDISFKNKFINYRSTKLSSVKIVYPSTQNFLQQLENNTKFNFVTPLLNISDKTIAEKYNWHPHSIEPFYTNNRIYLSKKCGTFHYDDSLVLTQKDQPRRSMWQLPSFFAEKGIAISWQGHTHPVIKGDSSILKTASRGQEFVITTDTKEQEENLSDWVKEITSHK